ncbi:MAG: hypothetical protein Q8K78_05255 [Planctomycetaceae bacterium]|nr:hypothetical protein [Planctomycetaceae bacterium]
MPTPAPNRREFLQAAAATACVSMLPLQATAAASPTRRPWKWAPEPGLWETVCGDDVTAQLHAAADAGFTAFADPDILQRSKRQRDEFRAGAQQRAMRIGPFRGPTSGYRSFTELATTFEIAAGCGVSGSRAEVLAWQMNPNDFPAKRADVVKQIQSFTERAAFAWRERFSTEMIPVHWEPQTHLPADRPLWEIFAETIHEANHPLCRLSVDTYRLASAGIDVVSYMQRHTAIIGHVELADYPGGFEPGSGTLDIAGIVAATALSPHDGVIGLRCGLSQPRQAGLDRLIAAARHHHGLRDNMWT